MAGRGAWSHERRENLAELDPVLRDRLLRLDEPVDRSDWAAVVQRSRVFRRSRHRSFALVASGAAVLSLSFTVSLVPLFPGAGHPRPGAAPLRLSLHLSDGSGLVLYSVVERDGFRQLRRPARRPALGAQSRDRAILERRAVSRPRRARSRREYGAARDRRSCLETKPSSPSACSRTPDSRSPPGRRS